MLRSLVTTMPMPAILPIVPEIGVVITEFDGPIIELHITNIHRREDHYHHSYISKIATAVIAGLGPGGYPVAVHAIVGMLTSKFIRSGRRFYGR
jgi:hypothetical protein